VVREEQTKRDARGAFIIFPLVKKGMLCGSLLFRPYGLPEEDLSPSRSEDLSPSRSAVAAVAVSPGESERRTSKTSACTLGAGGRLNEIYIKKRLPGFRGCLVDGRAWGMWVMCSHWQAWACRRAARPGQAIEVGKKMRRRRRAASE